MILLRWLIFRRWKRSLPIGYDRPVEDLRSQQREIKRRKAGKGNNHMVPVWSPLYVRRSNGSPLMVSEQNFLQWLRYTSPDCQHMIAKNWRRLLGVQH